MCIKTAVILSCLLAVCLAVDEHRQKVEDARAKRNLEYSISHNYPVSNSYRLERRISTGPRYNPYFPGPRPYTPYRKGRPHSLPAPPYAVQMEPLVHYSQRDPLYDTNALSLIADGHNELTKTEDLLTENNHITENVYGPPKHVIERPVYIKEPEPIIEIIIKESNVTLPPQPVPTPPPKKKEQVQVFYVKYKKNPHGHGKDSVIYDTPVPALSPVIQEEHEEKPHSHYEAPQIVTSAPPPSTTLRTVIRPESEVYHGPSGIKVTFGKEGFDHDKRSSKNDDANEESAPQPAISHPQARQFPIQSFFQRRFPFFNYQTVPSFRPDPQRIPQPYKPFTPPPTTQAPQYKPQSSFGRQYPQLTSFSQQNKPPTRQQLPSKGPTQFHNQVRHQNVAPQYSQQQHPPAQQQNFNFNFPRQPVPYQPFEQVRPQSHQPIPSQPPQLQSHQPQQAQFQFSRPQTHFPTHQQPPLSQQPVVFNQQISHPPQHQQSQIQQYQSQPKQPQRQQQLPALTNHQQSFNSQQFSQNQYHSQQPQQQHVSQQQYQQQLPQQYNTQQFNQQQQFNVNSLHQTAQHILPPGGELIQSLPKYEQHISVAVGPSQQPETILQQSHQLPQQNPTLTPQQYDQKIQEQFKFHDIESSTQHPHLQQQQQYFIQNGVSLQQNSINFNQHRQTQSKSYTSSQVDNSTPRTTTYSTTTPRITYQTTTTTTPKPTTTQATTTTKEDNSLSFQLPDEVPDELRQQLLSSGILKNADISVLDYDKVGDIPLSALPPDQLANFYSAGGAQQIAAAGSAPIPSIVDSNGNPAEAEEFQNEKSDMETEASESQEVKIKPPVEMKVVHYDPQTAQGQQVQDAYVQDGATQVDPVVLNDEKYTRYLPLKVSGAQFPIPDVPELKGKIINSVVVLAPVDYNFQSSQRKTREANTNVEEVEFVSGSSVLKDLLENPTLENYQKFLENENKTSSDKQSVILLVVGSNATQADKEIFMYDIATKTVSKLNGELSAAFVEAAETNSGENSKPSTLSQSASTVVETRVLPPGSENVDRSDLYESENDQEDSASDLYETRVPIEPEVTDLEPEASEQVNSFIDVSGTGGDLTGAASETNSVENRVYINMGYSKTGYSLPSS